MDDLNALNQRIQEQGGEVIGINTETLDGNADNIAAARQILEQAGATFRNIYFDSASDAGKFALGIMAFPLPALWIVRATSLGNRLWAVLIKRITLPHCKS